MVDLDPEDLDKARFHTDEMQRWATERNQELNLWDTAKVRELTEAEKLQRTFMGIAADMAVAKTLGIEWLPRPYLKWRSQWADVQPNIWVTFNRSTYADLPVRVRTPEISYHALVHGRAPRYEDAKTARLNVAGFISKQEARRVGKAVDLGGRFDGRLYLVGWHLLHPIEELMEILHG